MLQRVHVCMDFWFHPCAVLAVTVRLPTAPSKRPPGGKMHWRHQPPTNQRSSRRSRPSSRQTVASCLAFAPTIVVLFCTSLVVGSSEAPREAHSSTAGISAFFNLPDSLQADVEAATLEAPVRCSEHTSCEACRSVGCGWCAGGVTGACVQTSIAPRFIVYVLVQLICVIFVLITFMSLSFVL